MPYSDRPRGSATVTRERYQDDVARARAGVHNAEPSYGRHAQRRTLLGTWRGFSRRYGWRAYALPILVTVTIVALVSTTGGSTRQHDARPADSPQANSHATAPPVAAASMTLKKDAPGASANDSVLEAAALPPGAAYTAKAKGTFRVLEGTSSKVGTGHLYRYSIDVENGLSGIDLKQFQDLVVATLADKRSWSGHGVALERVDSGPIDFHVTLTSSLTVRKLCGYTIKVESSCYVPSGNGSPVNRVVINDARWVRGSAAYVGDLAMYRIYMINHEDGHAMGHQHAHQCLPGGLAPAMMQQTFGLRSAATGAMCAANPWPYPPGAQGAPGAEQPDTPQNDEYGLSD